LRIREKHGEYEQLVEEERLILEASELIHRLMDEQHVSRSGLAKLIGKSKGHISQLLDGQRNMTLRTLARLAYALDHRLELEAYPVALARRSPAPVLTANLESWIARASSFRSVRSEDVAVWPRNPDEAPHDERVAAAA
jgi:transcriptional regulator with XRE-family HTH domain